MRLPFLLFSIVWAHFAVAASIPRSNLQQPLTGDRGRNPFPVASVILGFTEVGSDEHKRIEVPLNTRVSLGT